MMNPIMEQLTPDIPVEEEGTELHQAPSCIQTVSAGEE